MKTLCLRCIRQDHCCNYLPPPLQHLHGFGYNGIVRIHLSTWLVLQLEGSVHSVPRDVTLPSLDNGYSCGDGYGCRFTGRTWERRFRAIQRHIYSHKIMEADRYSSGVEEKRIPTKKIIIFACDTTDVAEGREINVEGWEVKIAHQCRFSRRDQREE